MSNLNEKSPPGWGGTTSAMKKHHPEIKNPWALAWSMKNKGYKSHYKNDPKGTKSKKEPKKKSFREWLNLRESYQDYYEVIKGYWESSYSGDNPGYEEEDPKADVEWFSLKNPNSYRIIDGSDCLIYQEHHSTYHSNSWKWIVAVQMTTEQVKTIESLETERVYKFDDRFSNKYNKIIASMPFNLKSVIQALHKDGFSTKELQAKLQLALTLPPTNANTLKAAHPAKPGETPEEYWKRKTIAATWGPNPIHGWDGD